VQLKVTAIQVPLLVLQVVVLSWLLARAKALLTAVALHAN
jgi:hypothetical protein